MSQPHEVLPLARYQIVGLDLLAVPSRTVDGNGNGHYLKGTYLKRVSGPGGVEFVTAAMHDVFFQIIH